MEAPEVACPGSRRLTRRRFGLPPSRFGAPDFSVADRWSWHLLPEQRSFLVGVEQAQQRQRDGRAFFFFFPPPLIYKAFGSFSVIKMPLWDTR